MTGPRMVMRSILAAGLAGLIFGAFTPSATADPTSADPNAPYAPYSQIYTIMNTDIGVYMRGFGYDDTAEKITGFGVYKNEQVRAYCYVMGDPVGPFGNQVWDLVDNITRPTIKNPDGDGYIANSGYINTHYIRDGQTANNPDPNLPEC